jgi:hypothetical protein
MREVIATALAISVSLPQDAAQTTAPTPGAGGIRGSVNQAAVEAGISEWTVNTSRSPVISKTFLT